MKALPKNISLPGGSARERLLTGAAAYEMRVLRSARFDASEERRRFSSESFGVDLGAGVGMVFRRIDPSHYMEGFTPDLKAMILGVPNRNDDLHLWAGDLEDQSNPMVRVEYPYYLSTTMVTNRMFAAFVADTGYRTVVSRLSTGWYVDEEAQWVQGVANEWNQQPYPMSEPDHPVTQVSWFDAMHYAAWVSGHSGVAMRLPTSEEWILAARPEARRDEVCIFPWGNELEGVEARMNFGTSELEGYMWIHEQYADGHAYTSPVDAYPPNDRGLYDMCGNVWVWNHACEAIHDARGRADRVAAVTRVEDLGAERNARLSMHGGCYLARLTHANLFSKMAHPATDGACDIGFRLAAVPAARSGGFLDQG